MESDQDGPSYEHGPDFLADESTGNSSDEPFDYSIDEVVTQEQIVSPSPAPKLLDPTNKSSSYPMLNLDKISAPLLPDLSTSQTHLDSTIPDPQRSERAATPLKTMTAPLKPVINELVSCLFQPSSSHQLVECFAAEGLSVPIDTPEKATGDITLPSTDLQGALSSLQPQCWLSSTAIKLVLSLYPSKSFRVFDPLAYNIEQPEIRNIKSIPNNMQYALLPLYYKEHWTLALFDLKNYTIISYDSLPG